MDSIIPDSETPNKDLFTLEFTYEEFESRPFIELVKQWKTIIDDSKVKVYKEIPTFNKPLDFKIFADINDNSKIYNQTKGTIDICDSYIKVTKIKNKDVCFDHKQRSTKLNKIKKRNISKNYFNVKLIEHFGVTSFKEINTSTDSDFVEFEFTVEKLNFS